MPIRCSLQWSQVSRGCPEEEAKKICMEYQQITRLTARGTAARSKTEALMASIIDKFTFCWLPIFFFIFYYLWCNIKYHVWNVNDCQTFTDLNKNINHHFEAIFRNNSALVKCENYKNSIIPHSIRLSSFRLIIVEIVLCNVNVSLDFIAKCR